MQGTVPQGTFSPDSSRRLTHLHTKTVHEASKPNGLGTCPSKIGARPSAGCAVIGTRTDCTDFYFLGPCLKLARPYPPRPRPRVNFVSALWWWRAPKFGLSVSYPHFVPFCNSAAHSFPCCPIRALLVLPSIFLSLFAPTAKILSAFLLVGEHASREALDARGLSVLSIHRRQEKLQPARDRRACRPFNRACGHRPAYRLSRSSQSRQ
jgi:hypothetical protein